MQMAQAQQPYWNSSPGGNVITTTEWLGADFGSLIPLRIQTRANQPIDFSTANLLRAQINERVTYPTLGAFTNVIADGFTLITGQPDAIPHCRKCSDSVVERAVGPLVTFSCFHSRRVS